MEAIKNGIELTGTLYTSAQGEAKDKLAYAELIWDNELKKAQSEINKRLAQDINNIDLSPYSTKEEVNLAILNVVGAAPEALDTLEEIATKLSDNDDVVAAITNTLTNKTDKSNALSSISTHTTAVDTTPNEIAFNTADGNEYSKRIKLMKINGKTVASTSENVECIEVPTKDLFDTLLTTTNNKVDKVVGKGLSTNDFTDALKSKLENLTGYDDTALNNKITLLETNFNTLLNSNPNAAINSFNEIIDFLNNILDTDTLEGILAGILTKLDTKADIDDLSNIIGSEVVTPIVSEVDNVTRDDLKKDLFIDQWNSAWKYEGNVFGKYDPENAPDALHPFMGNEIWMTYEEALIVMRYSPFFSKPIEEKKYYYSLAKTVPPLLVYRNEGSNSFVGGFEKSKIEHVEFYTLLKGPSNTYIVYQSGIVNCAYTFYGCASLKTVKNLVITYDCNLRDTFFGCNALEYVEIIGLNSDLDLHWSSKISIESLAYIVEWRYEKNKWLYNSDSDPKAITITLHPDAFARLTDGLIALAAEKLITFAVPTT